MTSLLPWSWPRSRWTRRTWVEDKQGPSQVVLPMRPPRMAQDTWRWRGNEVYWFMWIDTQMKKRFGMRGQWEERPKVADCFLSISKFRVNAITNESNSLIIDHTLVFVLCACLLKPLTPPSVLYFGFSHTISTLHLTVSSLLFAPSFISSFLHLWLFHHATPVALCHHHRTLWSHPHLPIAQRTCFLLPRLLVLPALLPKLCCSPWLLLPSIHGMLWRKMMRTLCSWRRRRAHLFGTPIQTTAKWSWRWRQCHCKFLVLFLSYLDFWISHSFIPLFQVDFSLKVIEPLQTNIPFSWKLIWITRLHFLENSFGLWGFDKESWRGLWVLLSFFM